MAARGARRGMSAREREAIATRRMRHAPSGTPAGAGSHGTDARPTRPCTGRPREREPIAARRMRHALSGTPAGAGSHPVGG